MSDRRLSKLVVLLLCLPLLAAPAHAQQVTPAPAPAPAPEVPAAPPSGQEPAPPEPPESPPSPVAAPAPCEGGEDPEAAEPSRQRPAHPEETPQEIWLSRCAMCHGAQGHGQTTIGRRHRARDLTRRDWQQAASDEKIRCVIRNGVPGTPMRGFTRHLDPAQLEGLLEIVRSFGPPVANIASAPGNQAFGAP